MIQYSGHEEYTFEQFTKFLESFRMIIDGEVDYMLSNLDKVQVNYSCGSLYIAKK